MILSNISFESNFDKFIRAAFRKCHKQLSILIDSYQHEEMAIRLLKLDFGRLPDISVEIGKERIVVESDFYFLGKKRSLIVRN